MPIPPEKQKRYSIIIASLRKKFKKKGMSKAESNSLSKQKADKAVGVK